MTSKVSLRPKEFKFQDYSLYIILFLYFFFGKWKIFDSFGISTDYLFWILIVIVLAANLVFDHKIIINRYTLIIVVYLLYQIIEYLRSPYPQDAIYVLIFNFLTMWAVAASLYKQGREKIFLKILYIGGLYFTITVLLQALMPSFINMLRRLLLTNKDYLSTQGSYENSTRYLSGLSSGASIAAFFICLFVAICVAKVFMKNEPVKHGVLAILGLIAVFLTQKRSLTIAIIVSVIFVVIVFRKDITKKIRFILAVLLIGALVIYILYQTTPAMSILLDRLFHNENLLSGRENMYMIMQQWFNDNKLLGSGIGVANHTFGFGGHNSYLQILSEEGIIGSCIFAVLVIPNIIRLGIHLFQSWNNMDLYNNKDNVENMIASMIGIIVILIYALAGNPFYDFTFCLTFFMLLAVPTQVCGEKYE